MFEPWDTNTRLQLEYDFRARCPGPYVIVWTGEPLKRDSAKLYFKDQAEETMWLLRWS